MRGAVMVALWVCATILGPGVARATEAEERRAQALYQSGHDDYVAERFAAAYDKFRQAYLLYKSPAFLFNMASALERMNRPHDGAEELRGYLRAVPDAPGRAEIEARIRALEEAQRILDAARPASPASPLAAPAANPRRKKIAIGVSVGVVGAVVLGLGLGLGLGLRQRYPESLLGAYPGTL